MTRGPARAGEAQAHRAVLVVPVHARAVVGARVQAARNYRDERTRADEHAARLERLETVEGRHRHVLPAGVVAVGWRVETVQVDRRDVREPPAARVSIVGHEPRPVAVVVECGEDVPVQGRHVVAADALPQLTPSTEDEPAGRFYGIREGDPSIVCLQNIPTAFMFGYFYTALMMRRHRHSLVKFILLLSTL